MQILKSGVLYFAVVFGAGFVLGPIRILWAVPRFGPRMAELMEMPIMLLVVVGAARWIVRGLAVPSTPSHRLGMGGVALALLLVAEFALVLGLRGLSIRDYMAGRDPVSGTVYFGMLGTFAVMPLLVGRKRDRPSRSPAVEGASRRAAPGWPHPAPRPVITMTTTPGVGLSLTKLDVTFLIADLAGFTALTEIHGSRYAAWVVTRYVEIVRAALHPGARLAERVGTPS